MNHSIEESPLARVDLTKDKMERWVNAQLRGEKTDIDVYGKPSEKQLKELENVRNLSKELQDNLHELETTVRIAEIENQAFNPTAPILDYSENHEFMSSNQVDDENQETREEEKQRLTKDGRISLKASRVVEKVIL